MQQFKNLLKNNPYYIIIFLIFLMFIVTFFLINKDSDELAKEEGVQIPKIDYESESKNQMEKLERKEKEDEVNNESAKKEKEDIKIKKTKPVIGKKEKDEEKTKSKILSPRETIVELHKGLKKINSKSLIVFESTLKNVKQNYNSEKMLSMIIGNQWKNVSNEKRKEIINVFEEYIAKNYVRRFNKMKDFSFVENKEQNVGKFVMVRSNLVIGKEEKVSISYLLSNDKNVWKIFDVLVAGSVSEIATKKSEFRNFIKGRNIDPLIDALKKKNKDLI